MELNLPNEFVDQAFDYTDEKGCFRLKAIKDRDYKIRVVWQEDDPDGSEKKKSSPQGWRIGASDYQYLTLTKDLTGLRLVLMHRRL